jgi:hypothetical protein
VSGAVDAGGNTVRLERYLAAPVPSYRLMSSDGEDLGPFRAAVPDWTPGNRIHRGVDGDLVVIRLVTAEEGDNVDGYLIVESAT